MAAAVAQRGTADSSQAVVSAVRLLHKDPLRYFDFDKCIGKGSYGKVYKAYSRTDRSLSAFKVIPLDDGEDSITAETQRELLSLCECVHAQVVRYRNTYLYENRLWIEMEYCECSLQAVMRQSKQPLTESAIAAVCAKVLHGLEYLHSVRNIIHRDVKAANILLTDQGEVKLADFGVSAQLSNTLTKRNTVIGTPMWMSPEMIEAGAYDRTTDLWSMGITAIELAQRHPPLHDVNPPVRVLFLIPSLPPPTLQHPERWSAEFRDFLSRCLTKNPAERTDAVRALALPFVSNATDGAALLSLVRSHTEMAALQEPSVDSSSPPSGSTMESTLRTRSRGATLSPPPSAGTQRMDVSVPSPSSTCSAGTLPGRAGTLPCATAVWPESSTGDAASPRTPSHGLTHAAFDDLLQSRALDSTMDSATLVAQQRDPFLHDASLHGAASRADASEPGGTLLAQGIVRGMSREFSFMEDYDDMSPPGELLTESQGVAESGGVAEGPPAMGSGWMLRPGDSVEVLQRSPAVLRPAGFAEVLQSKGPPAVSALVPPPSPAKLSSSTPASPKIRERRSKAKKGMTRSNSDDALDALQLRRRSFRSSSKKDGAAKGTSSPLRAYDNEDVVLKKTELPPGGELADVTPVGSPRGRAITIDAAPLAAESPMARPTHRRIKSGSYMRHGLDGLVTTLKKLGTPRGNLLTRQHSAASAGAPESAETPTADSHSGPSATQLDALSERSLT